MQTEETLEQKHARAGTIIRKLQKINNAIELLTKLRANWYNAVDNPSSLPWWPEERNCSLRVITTLYDFETKKVIDCDFSIDWYDLIMWAIDVEVLEFVKEELELELKEIYK